MRTCARWGCLWRRRRIRGDRLATPSPHCAAARQAQFLVSITIGQSIYCIFAIDTTDVLWYNPFVIDSMCVSSPLREGRPAYRLGSEGFRIAHVAGFAGPVEKQQGCSARRFLGLYARAGGKLAPMLLGDQSALWLFLYIHHGLKRRKGAICPNCTAQAGSCPNWS